MHHGQSYKVLSDVGQCYCPQLYPNNCSMAPTKIDGILTVVLVPSSNKKRHVLLGCYTMMFTKKGDSVGRRRTLPQS